MATTIKVPNSLIFESSIEFAKELRKVEACDEIIFDFKNLTRIDPFSLLFISSEIQRCRHNLNNVKFKAINYDHCTYEAHMGFFQAFGLKQGKMPGEAKGGPTYIPITIYQTALIRQEARDRMINPAELLESEAKRIADILTRHDNGDTNSVLTYCIREIFRNVIEHSQAGQFGFCAQYRPSLNRVSFAIIDRGIGLKESLKDNPNLTLLDDKESIIQALKPAVSGKVYPGQKRKPKGEWANSGYGLFMTSNICKKGGGFFIASGSAGYYLSEKNEKYLETPFEGTAVNLAINTTRISELNSMLREIDDSAINSKSKPSKSSLGLMNE